MRMGGLSSVQDGAPAEKRQLSKTPESAGVWTRAPQSFFAPAMIQALIFAIVALSSAGLLSGMRFFTSVFSSRMISAEAAGLPGFTFANSVMYAFAFVETSTLS